MKKRKIIIYPEVKDDLKDIALFIKSKSTHEAARKYVAALAEEIRGLSILADKMQYSQWQTARKYHPQAKRLISNNRKWNIIFHIANDGTIRVHKIIPSRMMR